MTDKRGSLNKILWFDKKYLASGIGFMIDYLRQGVLAQLGEHLPYKQRVIGSSPIGPIYMPMWLNWQSS